MNQVDVGVGFQQIAPHALARMRLSGDEKDAQLVPHAVDVDHCAIAVGRQLALDRGDLEFDHVGTGMIDPSLDVDPLADGRLDVCDRLPVVADRHPDRLVPVRTVEHAGGDDLILADDPETRRFDQLDAPLPLALVAGHQHMQWGAEAQRRRRPWYVVHVSVGDHDCGADALGRRVRKRSAQRGEELRALGFRFLAGRFRHPDIDVRPVP